MASPQQCEKGWDRFGRASADSPVQADQSATAGGQSLESGQSLGVATDPLGSFGYEQGCGVGTVEQFHAAVADRNVEVIRAEVSQIPGLDLKPTCADANADGGATTNDAFVESGG